MISVIIPLYNKEKHIQTTLTSLLAQEGVDFEIIVVDDGSTDNSVTIVKKITDSRIRLVTQPNGGPSSARNTGVRYAKYEWILYLDADDLLLRDALNTFAKYISTHDGIDCFFSNFYVERDGKRVIYAPYYPDGIIRNTFKSYLFRHCMPRTGTAIFHRKFLQKYPFNETLRRYEDLEQLFRMFINGLFFRIQQPLFTYNTDGCSLSSPRKDWNEDFAAHIEIENHLNWQNIALYFFYLSSVKYYPKQCKTKYTEYPHYWKLKAISFLVKCALKAIIKLEVLYFKKHKFGLHF